MTGRSGVDAVASLCRVLDEGDSGPLAARLDDKSFLRIPGFSGLGGNYQGRDAIVGVLRRMVTATGGTMRFDVHGTPVSRRGALRIEGRLSGSRNGRPASAAVALDVTLDGQVFRSITIECGDRSAWDALWGQALP